MLRQLFSALALTTVLAPSALAADLFVDRPAPYAEPGAPAPNWAGFYAGSHIGYGFGEVETTSGGATASADLDAADNTTGGALFGWNFQSGKFVYGLEGALSVHEIKSSYSGGAVLANTGDYVWSGEARARLGYDAGRFLPYIAGGLVVGEFYQAAAVGTTGDVQTVTGFTVGAGVDVRAWRNWIVRAEYLYQNFGEEDYNVGGVNLESDLEAHIARVAIITQFGTPSVAPAAETGEPLFAGPSFGFHAGYATGESELSGFVTDTVDVDGALAGVHSGYLFALGNFRLGAESELSFDGLSGSSSAAPLTSFDYDVMWHAALRAKVGYVYNRFMPYLTAGANLAQFETTAQPGNSVGVDPYKTGYSFGGGLEYAVSNSLAVDLNYTYNTYDDTAVGVVGGDVDADLDFHQVRLGVTIR